MLQISTGKYFEEEKQRKHDEKFVFYSNVQTFKTISIDSPKILVELVESGGVSCYVVSYQLVTEEHPIIIKCGEQDFIQQFLLAWAFFFDCIAKNDKSLVQKICREKRSSSYDQQTTSEVSPKIVQLNRNLAGSDVDDFVLFVNDLVSTNRSTYKSIMSSLKIVDDAKETISTNFDLAYSTMVYAIESLSQKHDGYIPKWEDYHDEVRRKIDPILNQLDEEISTSIKHNLIEGKQFRLRKRLETFVQANLDVTYFREYLGENTNTMRTSYLLRCLDNLYKLRSSFVHELKPLDVMLSSPHSPDSDYITRFGEPYLTYSGLNRMIKKIILNFTKNKITDISETIEWTSETSSTIVAEMSAECWIHNPTNFDGSKANKWFGEYVRMLNNKKVTEQQKIMDKIENIFDGENKIHKKPLLHYYWLYNAVHNREQHNWHTFIEKRTSFLGESVHFYVVLVYLNYELSYKTGNSSNTLKVVDLDEFDEVYEKYLNERFHKYGLSLCGYTEAALLAAAANIALNSDEHSRYSDYLNRALSEIVNKKDKYRLIEKAMENNMPVDIAKYFERSESEQD